MIILDTISKGRKPVAVVSEGRTIDKCIGWFFIVASEGGDDVFVVGPEEWTGEPGGGGTQETLVSGNDHRNVTHYIKQVIPSSPPIARVCS